MLPQEIIGLEKPEIIFIWEDDHKTHYSALDLRLRCRCAFCIEEMSGRPLLDPTQIPTNIVAKRIELIGRYAVGISWSDGHETGIYNFRDLRKNCACTTCKTQEPTLP